MNPGRNIGQPRVHADEHARDSEQASGAPDGLITPGFT